jgi:predicted nucleic acid-binding protein
VTVVTRFAIDAPSLLQLVGGALQVHPNHQLVAPNAIRSDALGILLQQVRAGDIPEKAALELHERLTEVKMRLLGDRVSRRTAWRIAMEQGWTTMLDAEYLSVAKLQADALVAGNPELAARAVGIVPLAALPALLEP